MRISMITLKEIVRKEFLENARTKRLIIIGGLYSFVFLATAYILSSLCSLKDFLSVIGQSHKFSSLFYAILPIVISHDLVTRERMSRSIYLLLSKPVTREEVILGKFLGALSIVGLVVFPVTTLGLLIFSLHHGFPSASEIGRSYIYLGIVLLTASCYISLSMLFSVVSRSSFMSLILSLLVGWFGLSIIYPMLLLLSFYLKGLEDSWCLKLAYLVSPDHYLSASYCILQPPCKGGIVTPEEAIISAFLFLFITLLSAIMIFRRIDVN